MHGSVLNVDLKKRELTIELDGGGSVTLAFEEEDAVRLEREVRKLGVHGARQVVSDFERWKKEKLEQFAAGQDVTFDPEKLAVRDCIRRVHGV